MTFKKLTSQQEICSQVKFLKEMGGQKRSCLTLRSKLWPEFHKLPFDCVSMSESFSFLEAKILKYKLFNAKTQKYT